MPLAQKLPLCHPVNLKMDQPYVCQRTDQLQIPGQHVPMETISVNSIVTAANEAEARKLAPSLRQAGRPDSLTAQKVEVAIILQAMLGTATAAEYLETNAVNSMVVQRVLHHPQQRRGRHDANGILC
jgi:hypothetical protein